MLVRCALLITSAFYVAGNYTATWDSLDKRPLPKWYDEAKIGILVYWGVFSVPSFRTSWFWVEMKRNTSRVAEFMRRNYKPGFQYTEFASQFTAEFYDPDQWAEIFAASGAKYVVLTSKQFEGYAMWPSKESWNWNAQDIGPGRDLLGELAAAIRKKNDLRFGVYYCLTEWYHPLFLNDEKNHFKTNDFAERKLKPEMMELVTEYKPEIFWSDGDNWSSDTYWKSKEFLAWLYNDSPVKDVVVVNDRWGNDCRCHHGGFLTCFHRFNPKTLQPRKWENVMTIDRTRWNFRRDVQLSDFLSIQELITTLAETVSCGGNILINVAPTSDGRITLLFEERLRQLGTWLTINGEAIYKSQPWTHQNDTITPNVWYTTRGDYVYTIVLKWPKNSTLILGALQPPEKSEIFMLGNKKTLSWKASEKKTIISFPSLESDIADQSAWVLKSSKISD